MSKTMRLAGQSDVNSSHPVGLLFRWGVNVWCWTHPVSSSRLGVFVVFGLDRRWFSNVDV